MLSGPFFDAAVRPTHARAPRDWENGETFGDGWGANAPINVGKRARNKDRARMERRALELEEQEQDDQGDWFANARNMRNRGVRGGGPGPDTSGHGFRKKDAKIRITRAWKSDDPPIPSPSDRRQSLLERVGDDDDHGHHSHSRDHRHGRYGRDRERENRDRDRDNRDRVRDRDRDKDRGRERGGWERSRDRDNDRDWDRGQDRGQDYGGELSIRGSASRNDSSRHTGLEMGELGEGRRREDSRSRSSRDRDRERGSRTSRDRGPRGPQYRGGYTR
jgi:protein AIR1/2